MAEQVRLDQYKEFNPQPDLWRNDKRAFTQATKCLEVMVSKNFSKLALPCVAIYPIMEKGQFFGMKVAAPDGPLKSYFEQEDTNKIFFDLMQEACIDAMAKKEAKRIGQAVEASTSVTNTIAFPAPPRPVWILTVKELETYFSVLKTKLAAEEGKKLRRKWPKIRSGKETELPTKLDILDEVAEKILPSSLFVPGQKFPPGNLHWRLKLICSYIFMKYKQNPDTFAEEVPENFTHKAFTLKDLKIFSNTIDDSAKEHNEARKKKEMVDLNDVPFYMHDDVDYDAECQSEEEDVEDYNPSSNPSNIVPPVETSEQQHPSEASTHDSRPPPPGLPFPPATPGTSGLFQTCSRTRPITPGPCKSSKNPGKVVQRDVLIVSTPLPDNVFTEQDDLLLNASFQTGTPEISVDPDDASDDEGDSSNKAEMLRIEEEINSSDEYTNLMEATDLKSILSGVEVAGFTIQVFNFQKLSKAKCFRVHGHDSKIVTTKIVFSTNLNKKIEELLEMKPIIKITDYHLYNASFLVIKEFDVIKLLEMVAGTPKYLTDEDYEDLKSTMVASKNLPQTPTMLNKKLTDKHLEKIDNVPLCSSSVRIKNRSKGSSS